MARFGTAVALIVALWGGPAFAQRDSASKVGADAVDTIPRGAPVVLGTDTLFRLYGSLGPFVASARAAGVSARLRQLSPSIAQGDSIVVVDRDTDSELVVGEVILMTVLDADARAVGGSRHAVALRYADEIRSATIARAKQLSARDLLIDAGYAAAATVVLALSLWGLSFGFPRLYRHIEALRRVRLSAIRIQEFELLSAGRLSSLLVRAARGARVVVTLLMFYVYLPLVLGFFPWTAPLSRQITGLALRPFALAWVGLTGYLPNIFYLAAGVLIVRYALAFLHLLFGAVTSGAITIRGFYADWAEPTYKIMRVLVFAFAAMLLYPYLPGANSDAFKGVSLFLGVLFSLGSSAAIGNMVAGVVLTYTRAFQIGDRVQIGETVGDVIERTLLITRLRTIKNVAVTIPNGAVLGGQVVNYSALAATQGLLLHTTVTIGYDAPWREVHELLIKAATQTEGILSDPAPFVLQTSLDDFYVSYQLNASTDRADMMAATYSKLHQNIQETFNAGGVEIMSPHYGALRDGNQTTIPATYRPLGYRTPAFRLQPTAGGEPAGSSETATHARGEAR